MTRMRLRSLCIGLIATLLAGCSSTSDETNNLAQLWFGSVRALVSPSSETAPQPVVVTPDMLARTKVAALQLNAENTGGTDFLKRVSRRSDSYAGTVEIWSSSLGVQVFLRNGVIVGSRGLGGDMISADADVTVRALQARANRSGPRRYVVSDGDSTTTDMVFECTVRNMGVQNITIVNQVFKTHHLQENCTGGPGGDKTLKNDYWVETGTGLVKKSRQWIGPTIGYFEAILLKN